MDPKTGNSGIDIGQRLRAARVLRGLSQRELARKAGVTNGLISQIEQNRSSPSISSLKRILDAIPISLGTFFSDDPVARPKRFYRAEELKEINPIRLFTGKASASSISLRQVGDGADHAIQMLHERYPPGADTGADLYDHEGEEVGIVITGHIEVTVGEDTAELGPGDAYLFDSRIPHRFRNLRAEDCVIVSACTPPTF